MAERNIILLTKRSEIPSQSLPSSTKRGEAVVNLGDGILYYSGGTSGSPTWIPSGLNSGYFEVGSHLTNQYLDGKITGYEGISGAGLVNKYLKGTASGFTLDDISNISGVDAYITGATFNNTNNLLTLSLNENKPSVSAVIDITTLSGLTLDHNTQLTNLQGGTSGEYYHVSQTVFDALTGSTNPSGANPFATQADIAAASGDTQQVKVSSNDTTPGFLEQKLSGGTNISLTTFNDGGNEFILIDTVHTVDTNNFVTGNTNTTSATNNSNSYTTDLTYNEDPGQTYSLSLEDTYVSGGTVSGTNIILTRNDGNNITVDASGLVVSDTYVTGGTITTPATNNDDNAELTLSYINDDGGTYTLPFTNTFLSGGTLSGTNLLLDKNDGSQVSVDLSSLATDTYVTGFTYNPSTNTLTVSQNEGQTDLTSSLTEFYSPVTFNTSVSVTGTTTVCSLLPQKTWNVDGGCDIGAVGSRFYNVYTRFLQLGTSTTILGDDGVNFEMSGNTGDFIFRPAVDSTFHANILPGTDLGYDLGQPGQRWDNIYAGNISATGLTISGLGAGRIVYTTGSGGLTTEAGFTYNDSTDLLTVGNLAVTNPTGTTATIGQGGLVIGSGGSPGSNPGIGDLLVHGNLTVYGTETIVDTTNLYIEDNNITLNYNPTGDTSATYQGAGFTIQDGDGASGDIVLSTGILYLNGNINSNAEYTAATGASNIGFFTQMNDILIRNTNNSSGAPDGKRVIAEDDCLDGGVY